VDRLFGIHLAPPKTEELNSTIAYLESIYKNCFKPTRASLRFRGR